MKYKKILLLISCLMIPLLSGCGEVSKTYELKKAEVVEYNTLVTDTLFAYGKSKVFAEANQSALEEFVFTNKYFPALVDAKFTIPNITEEEIELFNYRSILENDFFTSLGSSTVRQVMVIKGKENHLMTVKIIWSENEIIDFRREVKKL